MPSNEFVKIVTGDSRLPQYLSNTADVIPKVMGGACISVNLNVGIIDLSAYKKATTIEIYNRTNAPLAIKFSEGDFLNPRQAEKIINPSDSSLISFQSSLPSNLKYGFLNKNNLVNDSNNFSPAEDCVGGLIVLTFYW